ncbi:MAG: hypothetical protein ACRCY8_17230 [Dermatophilaceae bacterium]
MKKTMTTFASVLLGASALVGLAPSANAAGPIDLCKVDPFSGQINYCSGTTYGLYSSCQREADRKNNDPALRGPGWGLWACDEDYRD